MVPFKFRTGRHRVEQLYFSEAKWVLGKCCIDFIFPPALRIFWWHPVKGADFMSVWSWLWNHSLFYTYIIEAYNDLISGVKNTKSLIGWRNPKRTFVYPPCIHEQQSLGLFWLRCRQTGLETPYCSWQILFVSLTNKPAYRYIPVSLSSVYSSRP